MNIDWSKAPEDATHAGNSPYEKGVVTWFKGISDPASRNYFMNEGSMNAWAISSENLSAWDLIERPKKQDAWDGEGLPPVGTVCDMHIDDFGWITGTVVVHIDLDEPTAVAHNGREVFHGNASAFRPIKTDEQLEEEEKKKVIDDMQRIYEE